MKFLFTAFFPMILGIAATQPLRYRNSILAGFYPDPCWPQILEGDLRAPYKVPYQFWLQYR